MNFTEVQQAVIDITKRPDKLTEISRAINSAVAYCTFNGGFRRDLVEATIAIDATLYADTVAITGLARFRRFTYVKPTGVKYYLTPLVGEKIFTPKNQMQPNRYYIAGTNLTYTLSALAASLEVEYLAYPLTLDAVTNTTHWMLDAMPYAIIDLAAAKIFASVGDDASANRHQRDGLDFFLNVRRDFAMGD